MEAACADSACSTFTVSGGALNVVWLQACGGSNCDGPWGVELMRTTALNAAESDTIVWGTDDADTVIWGTTDADTIVWGTQSQTTVIWGNGRRGHHRLGTQLPEQLLRARHTEPPVTNETPRPDAVLTWRALSTSTRLYVTVVIVAGLSMFAAYVPRTFPEPFLFGVLVVLSCVTSAWKVNLPIPLASGATLSASYAANLMALLLLGPSHAVVVAVAGAWTQCTYKVKRRYPLYRTLFSIAAEVLTMVATGVVYVAFRTVVTAWPLHSALPALNRGLPAQALRGPGSTISITSVRIPH